MQLNHYSSFPSDIPVIVEDELFLYPFMISPIFLSDEKNIEAANFALENDTLVMICATMEGKEGEREFDAIYPVGVIGSIMRKIALPDGRIKILFQGLTKGKIEAELDSDMLLATVDVVETEEVNSQKLTAILEVVREKVRTLSSVSNLSHLIYCERLKITMNIRVSLISLLVLLNLLKPKRISFLLRVI